MKLFQLYFRMLRYRVAVMLLLFFLLGVASHNKITVFSLSYLWAIIALSSSYVSATTINDIADKKVDIINHPKSKGRPLITGEATEKDLYLVHVFAVSVSIIFSSFINFTAVCILLLSLLINYIYSLSPIKFSYRTYLAPLILSIAYVFIPYWLGTTVTNSTIERKDWLLITSLLFLFLGRILLKDFRDRKGDSLYNKPTFLLRYGKTITCVTSFISILAGNVLLFFSFPIREALIFAILELYFIAIFLVLWKLWLVQDHESEQIAIGIGAKIGNGLLLTILGIFVLLEYYASLQSQILFTAIISTVFLLNFLFLITKPQYAVIGYKG